MFCKNVSLYLNIEPLKKMLLLPMSVVYFNLVLTKVSRTNDGVGSLYVCADYYAQSQR